MKRVVFSKLKGGVGASTACANLAMHLAKVGGEKVAVEDLDHAQKTIENLVENFGGLIEMYGGGSGYDYLFTDSGAGIPDSSVSKAIHNADLIIVPARPGGADFNSTFSYLEWLEQHHRRQLKKTCLLFTNVQSTTKLAGDIPEMARECKKDFGVRTFKTHLSMRTGYALALTSGWKALPKAARDELASLALEVAKLA